MKTTRSPLRPVALAVLLFAGCLADTRPHVVIEFGLYPELFEGLAVEIDGKVAGTLKRTGAATRTGFALDKGEHTIRVLSPAHESAPLKIHSELELQKTMLLLELQEIATQDGRLKQVLSLRN